MEFYAYNMKSKDSSPKGLALIGPIRAVFIIQIPLAFAEHHRTGRKRNFHLFERSEFENSRHGREAQGSPKGRILEVPFLLVRFLWASKENEYTYQKLAEPINSDLA